MSSVYRNINGENELTPWWCYAYDCYYTEITGCESRYSMRYTTVAAEMPIAIYANATVPLYWSSEPRGWTKFHTSSTTSATRQFRTYDVPEVSTFVVMVNGISVPYTIASSDPFEFIVDDIPDGYMMVSYTISRNYATSCVGNTKSSIESNGRRKAQIIYPTFQTSELIRLRRIVNNIEWFLGSAPTLWIGGPQNTIVSGPRNIIRGHTPVIADHIIELQNALKRIEDVVDERVKITLPRSSFSTVGQLDTFMVKYLEEIMSSVQSVERIIMNEIYYGA